MKVLRLKTLMMTGATVALMSGCAQMGPEAQKGAVVGGVGAAGVTALVGGSGKSIATAGAIGAVAGGLYGSSKDNQ